jgi:DNA polymerase-3 subunit epsilon
MVFDVETTGIDHQVDQVIELCVQYGIRDEEAVSRTWRIKPTAPMNPGAQAVHGISMADLAECPSFDAVADEIAAAFAGADVLVGYNLAFDIDMIQAEMARLGRPQLELAGKKIVDPLRLWQHCEPRSLQHAHLRFVGNGFEAAHSASADVAATGRVLSGMLQHFKLHEQGWDEIAAVCDPQGKSMTWASWVGPSKHLRWEGEIVVIGFGKHMGTPLHELAAGPERSFLRWVVEKDFPPHVGEVCRAAMEMPAQQLLAWVKLRFGQPASTAQPAFAAAK